VEKIIALGMGLLISFPVYSQVFLSTRHFALAGAELSSHESVLSATLNPASLSLLTAPMLEAAYSPAPFGLSELRTMSAGVGISHPLGNIGIFIQHYGFELYNENQIQICIARQIFDSLSVGASFTGYSLAIKNYGNDFTLICNAGFSLPLDRNLKLGFSMLNITGATVGPDKNKLHAEFHCGITYSVPAMADISIAIEKTTGYQTVVNTGMAFRLTEYFEILCGYKTDPAIVSAGISVPYDRVTFSYALQKHPELGFTQMGGISLRFSVLSGN
jgi:hypothetical protein